MYTIPKKMFQRALRPLPILIGFLSGLTLSACAGLVITTWQISARDAELQRKDAQGHVIAHKPLTEADDYRCYSPVDDEAWRKEHADLRACCNSKN